MVKIECTYGELRNHKIRRLLRKLNPLPKFKGLLLHRQVIPASSPVKADSVGESALPSPVTPPSSVPEDTAQPLRRSTTDKRPPVRFKDFIMS